MNIIRTKFFNSQFNKLKRKFPKIVNDIDIFERNINIEPYSDLGNGVYKFRIKNSSIPIGKRGGFRVIILFLNKDNAIPLYIYSKNDLENIFFQDIIKAKKIILNELKNKS